VTEEQRRQAPARKQPSGLPIFAAAAALLAASPNLWQRAPSPFCYRL
jgi:hypothetical protein